MKSDEERAIAAKQRSAAVKNAKEYMASERELQATRKSGAGARGRGRQARRRRRDGEEVDRAARGRLRGAQGARRRRGEGGADEDRRARRADRRRAQAARSGGGARAARRAQEVLGHPHAARPGDGAGEERHLPGLQHEHPAAALQQLQRGDSIELCGTCNRIIYWDKLLENPDGEPAGVRRRSRRSSSFAWERRRRGRGGRWRRKPREESPGSTGQGAG